MKNLRNPVAKQAFRILNAFGIEVKKHRIYDNSRSRYPKEWYTLKITAPEWSHPTAGEDDIMQVKCRLEYHLNCIDGLYSSMKYEKGNYYIYFNK